MTTELLNVASVGKSYRRYKSELARFARWFGLSSAVEQENWVLRNIDFSVREGEAVALIGQNGAGKSTLLKMITGTIRPTEGSIITTGRTNAILELGLGFNPELTGRQNIMTSGGLLGHSQEQLRALMPDIEAFAELGEYFDQPLRTYSTGMAARLSFALATATRPNLLIVDEVLSVGDSYFQHKSFDRIRRFKDQGTSILLVTHSLGDVRELCDRVILLHEGTILKDGPPDEVVDYYNALVAARERATMTIEQRRRQDGWVESRSGSFDAVVRSVSLKNSRTDEPVATARIGEPLVAEIDVAVERDLSRLVLGVMLRDRTGHVVWGSNTWHTRQVMNDVKAGDRLQFRISFDCRLGPGSYSLSTALVNSDTHLDENYEWSDNAFVFDVANFDKPYFIGTSYLDASFDVTVAQQDRLS